MTFTHVHSPRWADAERGTINCFVKFETLKCEVPFAASPLDPEQYGREIFRLCAEGQFGQVAPFDPTTNHEYVVAAPSGMPDEFGAWPDITLFLEEANAEVQSQTPRGTILVWASLIEELLGRLLLVFLVDGKESLELLQENNGGLSTFHNRATAAFALGLITKRDLRTCDCIRSIRNVAAHEWQLSLTNEKFAKVALRALQTMYQADHSDFFVWRTDNLKFLVTMIYAGSCAFLASRLELRRRAIAQERRVEWTNQPTP